MAKMRGWSSSIVHEIERDVTRTPLPQKQPEGFRSERADAGVMATTDIRGHNVTTGDTHDLGGATDVSIT